MWRVESSLYLPAALLALTLGQQVRRRRPLDAVRGAFPPSAGARGIRL